MPYMPTWKERLEDARQYLGPILAGLVVLALGGWLVWHELLPRQKAKRPPPKEEGALVVERQRVSAEVDVLEKTYRRAVETGEGDAAVAKLLDRAIARQRARLRLEPAGNTAESDHLARLEAERGALHIHVATARSEVLEREAEAARAAGRAGETLDKLREALRLQREANEAAAPEQLKNYPREMRLAQAIDQAEAVPARAAVDNRLTLARAALARSQREEALKAFAEARAMQLELNQQHPGTRLAGLKLVDEIDGEIASLNAADLAENSRSREREAVTAVAEGRMQDAAVLYAAAAGLQREVNEKFPRSRAAAPARLEELDAKRQTALSAEPLARVLAMDREIAALLQQKRNPAAVEKIRLAAALVEKTAADFPRSRSLDAAMQRRLAYLGLRSGDLDWLQDQILSQVAPLPGAIGLAMLKTEVAQELYTRVMNENPSRNAGRALPVDSVSWHDAKEFCQRAGWLLGCRVRLPTEAEFHRVYEVAPQVWSADTSGGRSHEPGTVPATKSRFADLAGNLAEWLEPASEGGETAPVAGGSYLDATESLRQLPIAIVEKRERARHIGFRVVVELPQRDTR